MMRKGMTGFGRANVETDGLMVRMEIKSVNHRFFDAHLRLPEAYRHLEIAFRKRLAEQISRGKVDLWLEIKPLSQTVSEKLNEEALGYWLETMANSKAIATLGKPTWRDILSLPGVLYAAAEAPVQDEVVLVVLEEALEMLQNMRKHEGENIAELIAARCNALEETVAGIRDKQPALRAHIAEKLRQALAELQTEADPARFEQELVYLLAKADVDEEIDRLLLHIKELRETLRQDGAVGRKIDFLLQEINRETNTLGVKSADFAISQEVVNMKVWIEQIREQVQNLE